MAERKYSDIQDIINGQRQYCELLKNTKDVVFGLNDENCALVTELRQEVGSMTTGISRLRIVLCEMKNENEKLQAAICKLQSLEKFVDDIEDHPDFQRIFCSVKKEPAMVPMSESRQSKRPVSLIPGITIAELENVPYYTRGRIKVEDVNDFISSLNSTISKKYSIVRNRNNLKYEDKLLQNIYKQQERLCPGLTFFTEDDLKKFGFLRTSLAVSKLINILRSTQRIKEVRSDGFVRYVVSDM
ncbi:hypothetical protein R5R35_003296 [Gryllus longicercus]|uniref:SKA complex subunit 1 n=1 Tax=Gryllus longicercus TaxID=2509291 RepID=A0AAN9VJY5_9ORTH